MKARQTSDNRQQTESNRVYSNCRGAKEEGVAKCDVEENDPISTKYGVRNLPTIVFVKGGEVVDKHVGSISKVDLTAKIESHT